LDELADSGEGSFSKWVMQDRSDGIPLEQSAINGEIHEVIQQVIQQDLTEKQRQVLILMVFNEVPLDEVVRYMGSNRNSIYKLLHDARRKLKDSLQNRGLEVEEVLASFTPQG
jgi:RNA polymerase sigma-70 factor, ECF subfamily